MQDLLTRTALSPARTSENFQSYSDHEPTLFEFAPKCVKIHIQNTQFFVWISDNLNMAITRYLCYNASLLQKAHPLKHPKHLIHLFQFIKFISTPIYTIQVSLVRLGLVITSTLIQDLLQNIEPDADALGYCISRNQLHIRELKGLYLIHKFPLRYHNV